MNCFYHTESDAVGICKHCARGLCPECAVDVAGSLACQDRCETEVKQLAELVDQHVAAVRTTSDTDRNLAIWLTGIGLLFGIFAVLDPAMRFFLLPVTGIFLAGAAGSYVSSKRYREGT